MSWDARSLSYSSAASTQGSPATRIPANNIRQPTCFTEFSCVLLSNRFRPCAPDCRFRILKALGGSQKFFHD